MNNINSKLSLLVVCLIVACFQVAYAKPIKRNIAWCVDICMEDRFDDMHNNGDSWGTGSSSMSGMTQSNIFIVIKEYCESVYINGCYEVTHGSVKEINYSVGKAAGSN